MNSTTRCPRLTGDVGIVDIHVAQILNLQRTWGDQRTCGARGEQMAGWQRSARLVGRLARQRNGRAGRAPAGGSRQAQQQVEPARGIAGLTHGMQVAWRTHRSSSALATAPAPAAPAVHAAPHRVVALQHLVQAVNFDLHKLWVAVRSVHVRKHI